MRISASPPRSALPAWLVFLCAVLAAGCATPPPPPPPGIALIMSDRSPAFSEVQREIARRYTDRIQNYYLDDGAGNVAAVSKRLQASDISVVVAIGLPAARLARDLSGKRVVFCQVFNYEEAGLVLPGLKGVAATPPADELFRTWKQLSPRLKTVGMITGRNLRNLVDEAQAAAARHGIKLIHVEARSDKESQYAFKRLAPRIEGLWMVPDNRVLSRAVIRDMMAYGVRQGKQMAVFDEQLLALGGLLSAETDAADIAERVLERVGRINDAADAGVSGLEHSTIRINSVMAARLNLKIPKPLRMLAHAP